MRLQYAYTFKSGGQKRRVSMAIALLQEPKLLILDEPTVGVDPLLRERIWKHLVDISKTGQTTIIITTHYIEEARLANHVTLKYIFNQWSYIDSSNFHDYSLRKGWVDTKWTNTSGGFT